MSVMAIFLVPHGGPTGEDSPAGPPGPVVQRREDACSRAHCVSKPAGAPRLP